jgi:threonine/homoserine/homoserine lactone efflux protein
MIEFIPDWPVMVAFTIACAVLFITPGPDMSLFLARTVAGGKMDGIAAFLGANTGSLVHTFMAAVGLSALLQASAVAFLVLKICGALYLVWLAVDAIRSGSTLRIGSEEHPRSSFAKIYLLGVGVSLTNPKIVLFFVTFLPQFVTVGDPHASMKLLFLGLYFIAFTLPCGIVLIFLADRFVALIRSRPAVTRVIDWAFASIFCLFAIKILMAERN